MLAPTVFISHVLMFMITAVNLSLYFRLIKMIHVKLNTIFTKYCFNAYHELKEEKINLSKTRGSDLLLLNSTSNKIYHFQSFTAQLSSTNDYCGLMFVMWTFTVKIEKVLHTLFLKLKVRKILISFFVYQLN